MRHPYDYFFAVVRHPVCHLQDRNALVDLADFYFWIIFSFVFLNVVVSSYRQEYIMTKNERELILDALYTGYGYFQPHGADDEYRHGKQLKFKVAIDILEKLYPNNRPELLS